ncbi:hypothetical protein HY346_02685 [Candidatus Microgenomates bacterium]|nr:hypothetical protein [Candidatus Microgenomates bacterium]
MPDTQGLGQGPSPVAYPEDTPEARVLEHIFGPSTHDGFLSAIDAAVASGDTDELARLRGLVDDFRFSDRYWDEFPTGAGEPGHYWRTRERYYHGPPSKARLLLKFAAISTQPEVDRVIIRGDFSGCANPRIRSTGFVLLYELTAKETDIEAARAAALEIQQHAQYGLARLRALYDVAERRVAAGLGLNPEDVATMRELVRDDATFRVRPIADPEKIKRNWQWRLAVLTADPEEVSTLRASADGFEDIVRIAEFTKDPADLEMAVISIKYWEDYQDELMFNEDGTPRPNYKSHLTVRYRDIAYAYLSVGALVHARAAAAKMFNDASRELMLKEIEAKAS